MPSILRTAGLAFLTGVSAISSRGQAIIGNALEGQSEEFRYNNSQWNKGLNSQSALGQLEELSGGKVDRSNNQPAPRQVQAAPVRKVLSSHQQFNRMVGTAVAGAVLESVLTNILFDDSAAKARAQAEAEARAEAEAAALAEAQRLAEEARLAQIQFAANLRAAWDARDQSISDTLAGAFDPHPGTAFFGIASNPDADTTAALVGSGESTVTTTESTTVALPDRASPSVDPAALGMPVTGAGISQGAPNVPPSSGYYLRLDNPPPEPRSLILTPRTDAEAGALIAAEWYVDKMKEAISDGAWRWVTDAVLHLPGMPESSKLETITNLREQYETLSAPMQSWALRSLAYTFGSAQQGVLALGSANRSGAELPEAHFAGFENLTGDIKQEAGKLSFNHVADRVVGGPEFGPAEEEPLGDSEVIALSGLTKGRYGHITISR